MKILHTADWHLGKRLDSFSRLPEQIKVMDEIVAIADAELVDLVLIAGDLFDHFHPSVDATELFYKTVKRLSKEGTRPVIAIGGNHDAPGFIDAPNPLAKACGIILIGAPNVLVEPFELPDFEVHNSDRGFIEIKLRAYDYPVRILHTAFANEQRLKEYLGEDKETGLNTVLAENWQALADKYCDTAGVNILMTHLYMNKKGTTLLEEPDGEKPLKIGNADMIYSESIPAAIQYTALGHLHGFRNIGTDEKPVVYASSPICYSFSEAGQTKYVSIVEAEPNQNVVFKKAVIAGGRPLYRKTFDVVSEAVDWLTENQDSLVELTMQSDTFLTATEQKSIYAAHDGIIHLIPQIKTVLSDMKTGQEEINLAQDIQPLFEDYFKSKNGNQAPSDELMNLFNEILNA